MHLSRVRSGIEAIKRTRVVATVLAVQARYGKDDGGLLAGALTYSGFLALFPLLLLALSVFGFVLASHPGVRASIDARIVKVVPGLGALIGKELSALQSYRVSTGIVGLVGLAWSGTRIVSVAESALGRVFGFTPAGGWRAKLRQLQVLFVLGLAAIASAVVAGVAGGLHGHGANGLLLRVGGYSVSLVADSALFLASYRILAGRHHAPFRASLPGAIVAGAGWTALKVFGSWYASRSVANAHAVYGTFATTLGVLVLLSLGARLFLYGAEIIALSNEGGAYGQTQDRPHRQRKAA